MKKLRRYQQKTVTNFLEWYKDPNEQLGTIILPTGTGKTFSATSCIGELYEINKPKVLWVAHREELIDQAFKEINASVADAKIQIEMASNRAEADCDIIVGSVQTTARKRKNTIGFEPDIIVIDEYHHYHEKNVQYHGLLERYPKAKILGLTATPFRFIGGDLPLGKKLIEMNIGAAIAHGYLVSPKAETLRSNVSIADVKSRAGDFAVDELSKVINTEERNRLIVNRLVKAIKEEKRQGILFAVDVAHSKALAEMLRGEGVRVGEVYGETDKDERRELMERVRNKEIDVLCNNLVATEGFDVPHMNFVCIARPTRSLGLYIQMMGRGLRLAEGKIDCLVIDVFDKAKVTQGIASYQKVAASGDIDGGRRRSEAIMNEELADKLKNFPVVMKMDKNAMWTIDNTTWFAPAWMLDTNQWVITWSKRQERKKIDGFEWTTIAYPPKKTTLQNKPLEVLHDLYGEGIAHDVIYGAPETLIAVHFTNSGMKNVPMKHLKSRSQKFEIKHLDKPIKRAIYIIANDNHSRCRVIALQKDGSDFSIQTDAKCDENTVNEIIRALADEDDMTSIVRANAPWRERPASEKQCELIKSMILWGKLNDDIDLKSLTGGDATALMDQVDWKPVINTIFGANTKEELIGYLSDLDDV